MQRYEDGYNDCSSPSSDHQFINPCGGENTQEYCRGYHDGDTLIMLSEETQYIHQTLYSTS